MKQYRITKGDRVTFAKNLYRHGVLRGDTALVLGVKPHCDEPGVHLSVKLDSGKEILVRASHVRYSS